MKIGSRILLIFLVFSIMLTLMFYFIELQRQNETFDQITSEHMREISYMFEKLENQDTKMLSSTLELAIQDSDLKEAYLKKDRELLYDQGNPLFQNLKNKYGITHFSFILPDGRVFLRLHNKEIYDDPVNRITFLKANETKELATGLELGKTAFALRAIRPYYEDGNLIGYVELSEEIDHFLKILKGNTTNEFAIIGEKKYLNKDDWRSVREVAGIRNSWDDSEKFLSISSTIEEGISNKCFSNLELESSNDRFSQFQGNGTTFICGGVPITDAGGQQIGVILSLINITDHIAIGQKSNNTMLGLSALIFIVTFTIGIFITRSITKPIAELKKATENIGKGIRNIKIDVESKDEFGVLSRAFYQMASDLERHTDHLDELVKERTLALLESEEKFEGIASTAKDAIILIDNDGKIEYWNDAARKIFGYSKQEMIKEDMHLILAPGKYHNAYREGFARLKMTGEGAAIGKTLELEAIRKDGTIFPIELSVSALKLKGKWHSIGILRDITERKKAEEKIIQLKEDLLRQSYETQSLLNSILNFALEDSPLEDILKKVLDRISSIPWIAVESKGSILLVEDEPDVLVLKVHIGLSKIIQEKCHRIPFGRCICGMAAQMHEIQFADHIDDRHDVVYDGIKPHGHYCVPIMSSGRTLGVMNLFLKEGHGRQQQEETFLIAVADTLAVIIQRKRSESALKESEERFRATTQSANDAIIAADGNGRIITWNDGAKNIFGYSEKEALGKPLTMLMPEQFKSGHKNKLEMATSTGKTSLMGKTLELRGLRKDDVEFPIELTLSTWEVGKERYYSGIIRDITERKRDEERLRESEERHRNLVNFSPYGIAIHSEGKIVYMNTAGANILGSASPDQFIGKKVLDIIHPDYHDIAKERIHMQEMGKVALPMEEVFVRANGTFVNVEVTAIPFFYEGKPAMYGVFKDITEHKRNEEMRLKNIRLEEADKVKSDFIASMSHELRTPLNASIGFSELLKMGSAGELNEKQGRYVDNILASNQFLLALINDILDISKVEAGKIELVIEKMSVPMTIKETLSLIKEKASKNNVHLNTEFDPELEFIDADKQRLKQVLFNLLSNAVKFTPKDGTVTIKTKIEGNMAQISVSDTGIGIKEENIRKLFQKFEQLEPGISKQYGGTGLGLAITKQLVELHGGKIWAQSNYGEGSTFTFLIPLKASHH